jgi:hypothetical protein
VDEGNGHRSRGTELCEDNGIGDWDLAFAHEALARASAVAGDRAAAEAALARARAAAEDIADPEDRELLDADLRTIPGMPPVGGSGLMGG